MKTVLLEEMSWLQIKNAMENGFKTVIIGAGSIEQHGPHLPEGTDSMMGYTFSELLAKELGNALVAPTIRPGLSEHHMAFPGSLTLRPSTFMAVMEDYVDCYIRHGFKTIIMLPTHGGNFAAVDEFVAAAQVKYPGTQIFSVMTSETMSRMTALSAKADSMPSNIAGAHAGGAETSTMLEFYPNLVDMSVAEEGFIGNFGDVRHIMLEEGMHAITKNGILGDARVATAEYGKAGAERMIKVMAEFVRERMV